jgi:dihydrofolate synthase/folylpolyglutamate synthase
MQLPKAYHFLFTRTGYHTGGRKVPFDGRKIARMRRIAEAYGNPQDAFKCVHVAGTKGKGSCAAMLAAALVAGGRTAGLYTSPHVSRIEERIQVNGREIEEKALCEIINQLRPLFEQDDSPTFFEAMTLAALLHFRNAGVDWAVVEAGTGGRYSATNIIDAECSIITSIGLEHADILGHSLAEIAREKAGVARRGKPLVTAIEHDEILGVIYEECKNADAELRRVKKPVEFELNLAGPEQRWNAACALAALEALGEAGVLEIDLHAAERAMADVSLPGRFEVVGNNPTVVLDGAHTVESARLLAEKLAGRFKGKPVILLFAASASKEAKGMLAELLPKARAAVFTSCAYPGFISPGELADIASDMFAGEIRIARNPLNALKKAGKLAGNGVVAATGSFYLVGEIRGLLSGKT